MIIKTPVTDINSFNLLSDEDKEAAIRKLKIILNTQEFKKYEYYYLEVRVYTDESSDAWWWHTTEPNVLVEQVKLWYF